MSAEQLAGEVARVVYANGSTGFGVVELDGDGPSDEVDGQGPRASGPLASLESGQPVRLFGSWREHPKYGPTFEATHYELDRPRTLEGLAAFLASQRFQGVGDVLATRIVDAFGFDLPDVVAEDPGALEAVRGVSAELAQRIGDAWRDAGAIAELAQRLATAGLSASLAQPVVRTLGDDALAVIDADPYRILDVPRVSWAQAEALARAQGVEARDERRLAAAAAAAHDALRRQGGHVAVVEESLRAETVRLLRLGETDASGALDLAAQRRRLAREEDRRLTAAPRWYRQAELSAERELAADVARLLGARSRVAPAVGELDLSPELTAGQREAVRAATRDAVSVLTGGPGTGKTRTVVEVVRGCEDADLRVACAAPTGRAARRLEELTGRPASTVHRLLEAQPADAPGRAFAFGYDRDRQLPHDLVIVDEWSMADLSLAHALFQAIGDGAHVLLVGDADQLPSVGPGAVLRDVLDAAAEIDGLAATRLDTVHRQAAESRIVTLAHEINTGAAAPPAGRDGDVFSVRETTRGIAARAAEIVADRAPAFFGCGPADVQVLAPMYRGPAGVEALNAAIKERVNPASGRPALFGFHEGDRVVQTRNDPEREVANGDIGEVAAASLADRTLEVAFPQGAVEYDAEAAEDLRPAWCLTVHKAQGGEWPVVVLVLDRGHRAMLWRELVYTGATRAREGLLLLGDPSLLSEAARRTGSGLRQRETLLAPRLVVEAGGG